MKRTEIINALINKHDYQSYLEIGVYNPSYNYFNINCKYKECVDPFDFNPENYDYPGAFDYIKDNIITYPVTSDEFFETIQEDKKYDIIFIDGLHFEEQVGRDIINGLKHLNPGGTIVVHDCLPGSREISLEENVNWAFKDKAWNGSVWKALPELYKQNIEFFVIDTDWGCAVIKYKENPEQLHFSSKSDLDYDEVFLKKTIRDSVLNVISEEEFMNKLHDGSL